MAMIRIYADFNERDQLGRPVLSIPGSLPDIEQNKNKLMPGLRVILYQPGELEVEATLAYDRCWVAVPDWDTIKHYDNPSGQADR
jgi:hypothetical protein